jgi:hypothetical protein
MIEDQEPEERERPPHPLDDDEVVDEASMESFPASRSARPHGAVRGGRGLSRPEALGAAAPPA